MNRRSLWLSVLALVLLASFAHLPALRNRFIWDDDDHLTANPTMTAPNGLRFIWTKLAAGRYYPLTLTTFWVQRQMWDLNPLPYHAVNIALHAANAALLFLVLRKLNVRGAWIGAALWAVHPVNVESVAWITELKNTQSALFFFLALLCYLRFETVSSRLWFALSVLCAAAATLSKPSTVVLPVVLLLLAWWQRGRIGRQDVVRTAPFFALAAAMSLVAIIEQRGHLADPDINWSLTLTERLILAGNAVWFYAGKLVWPVNLAFVYPRWTINADSILSLVPLAAAIALGFALWRYRAIAWARATIFGLGYFVIALLPVLGFFDIYFFRYSFVADHFQYLASAGIVALGGAAGAVFLKQRALRWGAAVAVVTIFAARSWHHAGVFRDNETLWRDTMAKNPQASISYNNLGALLNEQERYEEALEYLDKALALRPDSAVPHNNKAITLTGLGRYEEALEHFQRALQIQPEFAKSHYRLAVLYVKMNRLDEAEQHYLAALRYNKLLPEACFELGLVWERKGKRAQALTAYRDALKIKPDYAAAHNNLANLLAEDGKLDQAIEHYRRALAADPQLEDARRNLAAVERMKQN